MPHHIDLSEVLQRNPRIDAERLEEAQELFEQLRERGVQRKGYDLTPPFGGHRASPREDDRIEPNIVRLGPNVLTR